MADRKTTARAVAGTVIMLAIELGAAKLSDTYGWGFVALVGFSGLLPLGWGWWPEIKAVPYIRPALVAFVSVTAVVIIGLNIRPFHREYSALTRKAKANTQQASTPHATPLRHRFDTDFDNTLRHSADFHIRTTDQRTGTLIFDVTVRRTTYTDLAAHATFIGFYIPETPYTFAICEYLAAQWESILTDSRKEEVVQFTDPGDADWMNVNKFTITGKVYVYYEDLLTERQRVTLYDAFKQTGATVQFRSNH